MAPFVLNVPLNPKPTNHPLAVVHVNYPVLTVHCLVRFMLHLLKDRK